MSSLKVHNGPTFLDPDLEDVKNQMRRYEGGQVTLTMEEATGLALICLDHAEKKNCLSGKCTKTLKFVPILKL